MADLLEHIGDLPQVVTQKDTDFFEIEGTDGASNPTSNKESRFQLKNSMAASGAVPEMTEARIAASIGARDFEANHTYKKNQLVLYSGGLYRAKNAFTSAAAFNPIDWNKLPEPLWGEIEGTISDQTDLQDELDLKLDREKDYENGVESRFAHESDGGGYWLESNSDNSKTFLGGNADPSSDIKAEIYAVNRTSNIGARFIATLAKLFYTKGQTNPTVVDGDEIAVLADVAASLSDAKGYTDGQIAQLPKGAYYQGKLDYYGVNEAALAEFTPSEGQRALVADVDKIGTYTSGAWVLADIPDLQEGFYWLVVDLGEAESHYQGRVIYNAGGGWDINIDRQNVPDGETLDYKGSTGAIQVADFNETDVTADDTDFTETVSGTFHAVLRSVFAKIRGLFVVAAGKVDIQQNTGDEGKAMVVGPDGALVLSKLTASDIGLGNVDNTSDADKPISADAQTALDKKANIYVRLQQGTTIGNNIQGMHVMPVAPVVYTADWTLTSTDGATFVRTDNSLIYTKADSTIVAIIENGDIKTADYRIDDVFNVAAMTGDFAADQLFYRWFDVKDLDQRIGLLSALLTLDKSSIVNAINSLKGYIDGILESSEVAGSPYESYAAFLAGAGAAITPSKYAYVTFADTDTWPTGGKWDQITAGDTWRLDCSDTQWLPTSNMTAATTATLADQTATDALKQAGNDSVTAWLQNFRDVLKFVLTKYSKPPAGIPAADLAEEVIDRLVGEGVISIPNSATTEYIIYLDSATGNDSNDGLSAATALATLVKAFDYAKSLVLPEGRRLVIQCANNGSYTLPAGYIIKFKDTVILRGAPLAGGTNPNESVYSKITLTAGSEPQFYNLNVSYMLFDVPMTDAANIGISIYGEVVFWMFVVIKNTNPAAVNSYALYMDTGVYFLSEVIVSEFTFGYRVNGGFVSARWYQTSTIMTTPIKAETVFSLSRGVLSATSIRPNSIYTNLRQKTEDGNFVTSGIFVRRGMPELGYIDLASKVTDINPAINIGGNTTPIFYKKNGIYYLSFYCTLVNNANFLLGEVALKVNQTFSRFPQTNYSFVMNQTTGVKAADAYWYMDLAGNLKVRPAYQVPSSGAFELNVQISWPEEWVLTGGA